jgi:hypothetical protein
LREVVRQPGKPLRGRQPAIAPWQPFPVVRVQEPDEFFKCGRECGALLAGAHV